MPDKLPNVLSPFRDIQYAIDLLPESQLPNIPHYKMNLVGNAELNRQFEGILENDFIRHSPISYVVPILLTH